MISLPFRPRRDPTIDALYGAIVAQARSPAFYRDCGVPDTVSGRFELLLIHLVLVIRRLRGDPAAPPGLSQQLFDRFCRDMDDNLREMGIGDLAVPKHMRRVGEAFYGRAKAYEAALEAGDGSTLAQAIARNVYEPPPPALGPGRIATYMEKAADRLAAHATAGLTRGDIPFPDLSALSEPQTDGAPGHD